MVEQIARSYRFNGFAAAFLALMIVVRPALCFTPPKLVSPVQDVAKMMDEGDRERLDGLLQSVRDRTGVQIGVLTVSTLDGMPIEDASIKTVEAWKLGDRKTDRGVLLLVAKSERRIRIEVGQGLEGELTDLESREIIDRIMVPLFRSGRTSDGIVRGVVSIISRVAPGVLGEVQDSSVRKMIEGRGGRGVSINPIFLVLFVLFWIVAAAFSRRGGRRGVSAIRQSMWGVGGLGGCGGRSGGGFGGWSGGGGGFSGGGSSGGW